jgi:hypothetical protein
MTHARPARSRVIFPFAPLPDESPVKAQLDRIVNSRAFSGAHRSQHFLRYILQHAIARTDEHLKEYSIAIDVFERDSSYDPAVNNTVRVEAGRLRSRLLEYYAGEGSADPLIIEVPKGSYRVLIHNRPRNLHAPHNDRPAQQPITPAALHRSPSPVAASPRRPLAPAALPHLLAVSLAFLVGAFVGYRASH